MPGPRGPAPPEPHYYDCFAVGAEGVAGWEHW
jgi:hypothetical protein